ncbi:MAG: hypothetical protein K0V04_30195 [Deltaproteobacteria bacterium]|nr:hypothetical protein [Deltaproteobacteria bacterium]
MRNQGMMHPRHYTLVAILAIATTGACEAETTDDLELRAAAPGAGIGELDEIEQIEEPEQAEVVVPEDAKVPCNIPQATLANNCGADIPVTTCYSGKNGSRGTCDVMDCDEQSDTLYRCEGDVLQQDGKFTCAPQADSFEDCTEIE